MSRLSPQPDGPRHRPDRCPGVLHPWLAEDGALLRIRLVGGLLTHGQLAGLADLARGYGDGSLHLTTRANVQVRGVPVPMPAAVPDKVAALGLLPSESHERARNLLVSPFTGRLGGHADLRPLAHRLDAGLRADPGLAALPGRFLFALDDRGDLADRSPDVTAIAVGSGSARLGAGGLGGDLVPLEEVPDRLLQLARRFLQLRGDGPAAPWHVRELAGGGTALGCTDAPLPTPPPPRPLHGLLRQDDGRDASHIAVPDGILTAALLDRILAEAGDSVVVTPWRSLLLTDLEPHP